MRNTIPFGIPIRVIIGLLMFGGTLISYVLRVNINIAIVTMTENSKILCANKSHTER